MSKLNPIDYENAILSQSACNLGALAHSFSEVVHKIQEDGRNKNTEWINTHPIVRMYVEQFMYLASKISYTEAYNICIEKQNNSIPV